MTQVQLAAVLSGSQLGLTASFASVWWVIAAVISALLLISAIMFQCVSFSWRKKSCRPPEDDQPLPRLRRRPEISSQRDLEAGGKQLVPQVSGKMGGAAAAFDPIRRANQGGRTSPALPRGTYLLKDSGGGGDRAKPHVIASRTAAAIDGLKRISKLELSYDDVIKATNNFDPKRLIGRGGFGSVYKGMLTGGRIVAVKRMDRGNHHLHSIRQMGGADRLLPDQLVSELEVLARVQSKHLVNLVGYAIGVGAGGAEDDAASAIAQAASGGRRSELVLVYDYMPNGSLYGHLHGKHAGNNSLDWTTRLKIALDVAQGVNYLHHICKPPIIHRDIKAGNVLLNREFVACVADFGLSKLLGHTEVGPDGQAHVTDMSNDVKGTFGYVDPTYILTRQIAPKSDVYSYGILLLELLTGRKPLDQLTLQISDDEEDGPGRRIDTRVGLAEWAVSRIAKERIEEIMDPKLAGQYAKDIAIRVGELAVSCVNPDRELRPAMARVVAILSQLIASLSRDVGNKESGGAKETLALPAPGSEGGGEEGAAAKKQQHQGGEGRQQQQTTAAAAAEGVPPTPPAAATVVVVPTTGGAKGTPPPDAAAEPRAAPAGSDDAKEEDKSSTGARATTRKTPAAAHERGAGGGGASAGGRDQHQQQHHHHQHPRASRTVAGAVRTVAVRKIASSSPPANDGAATPVVEHTAAGIPAADVASSNHRLPAEVNAGGAVATKPVKNQGRGDNGGGGGGGGAVGGGAGGGGDHGIRRRGIDAITSTTSSPASSTGPPQSRGDSVQGESPPSQSHPSQVVAQSAPTPPPPQRAPPPAPPPPPPPPSAPAAVPRRDEQSAIPMDEKKMSESASSSSTPSAESSFSNDDNSVVGTTTSSSHPRAAQGMAGGDTTASSDSDSYGSFDDRMGRQQQRAIKEEDNPIQSPTQSTKSTQSIQPQPQAANAQSNGHRHRDHEFEFDIAERSGNGVAVSGNGHSHHHHHHNDNANSVSGKHQTATKTAQVITTQTQTQTQTQVKKTAVSIIAGEVTHHHQQQQVVSNSKGEKVGDGNVGGEVGHGTKVGGEVLTEVAGNFVKTEILNRDLEQTRSPDVARC